MNAPIRDARAEVRAALAQLAGENVAKVQDAWEWVDSLPVTGWALVAQMLGVGPSSPVPETEGNRAAEYLRTRYPNAVGEWGSLL